jgi:hypothetical protein
MTNTISKPTWFYKTVDVPNLELIQQQFQEIVLELISLDEPIKYFHIDRALIENRVPSYAKLIDSLGLLDRWAYSAIIATNGEEFPIHVDAIEWDRRCYALNLPVMNCDDSYTIWYDAEIEQDPIDPNPANKRSLAKGCVPGTAIEVCRMPAATPAWVNIALPHRPYTCHAKLRVVVSARFSPELHDYFI